jgi:ATP-dependent DNA ligase
VAGVEGVVVKRAAGRYQPGGAGWVKVRTRVTADYVIGGVTGPLGEAGYEVHVTRPVDDSHAVRSARPGGSGNRRAGRHLATVQGNHRRHREKVLELQKREAAGMRYA